MGHKVSFMTETSYHLAARYDRFHAAVENSRFLKGDHKMSADDIFLTAEEVMDRWGMMDPNDFDTMIGFEFSPNDDITTTRSDHRYRYRPGDLLAYDKYSREPAIWGPSEGGEDRDFSKFVDHNDALDPGLP